MKDTISGKFTIFSDLFSLFWYAKILIGGGSHLRGLTGLSAVYDCDIS